MGRARCAWLFGILLGCETTPPTPAPDASPDVAAPDVASPDAAPPDAPPDAAPDATPDAPADAASADLPVILPPRDVTVAEPDTGPPVDALGPLPAHASVREGRFMTHDNCQSCHAAATGVLRDGAGNDVSPPTLWRTSMKAVAARDPYWLAVVAQELEATPPARATIENVCTRCHAPAGNVGAADAMGALHIDDITRGTSPVAQLARDGVTCTACHQTTAEGLGTPASYTGGFVIGTERRTFGPHASPVAAPEMAAVNYTPTEGRHITTSAFCATCHTVITRALNAAGAVVGPEFPEQTCYLEWRNSAFRAEAPAAESATECQGCHMPARDADGTATRTILSNRPPTLMPRAPIGRHVFLGANGYMLSVLAEESGWLGGTPTRAELTSAADLADQMLRRATTLSVEAARRTGDSLAFNVRVTNVAGHRFPTGYPSRRAWLHVRVLDAGGVVRFEVGRTDGLGRFVDGAGNSLEARRDIVRPHLQAVTRDDQVQVYETVMVDMAGEVTHLPLRAARFLKDNRILPRGWSATHPDAALTTPTGVTGDADFRAGEDVTRFTLDTAGWVPARVEAEVLFQSISPDAALAAGQRSLPAGARFRQMITDHPPLPRRASSASAPVR